MATPCAYSYLIPVRKTLQCSCSVLFLLVGTVSNVLTVVSMRDRSTSKTIGSLGSFVNFFLSSLALADLLAIYTKMIPWSLENCFDVDIKNMNTAMCKIMDKFLNFCIGDFAIWLVVFINFDRFVALWFPTKLPSWRKYKVVGIFWAVLFSLIVFKNSFLAISYGLVPRIGKNGTQIGVTCTVLPPSPVYTFNPENFNIIALIFVAFLPVFLVVLLNILIVYRWRQRVRAIDSLASNSEVKQVPLLFAVSLAFFMFLMPFFLFLATLSVWPIDKCQDILKFFILDVLNIIFYLNHTSNFFLYVLMSKSFRRRLRNELLRCCFFCKRSKVTPAGVSNDSMTL